MSSTKMTSEEIHGIPIFKNQAERDLALSVHKSNNKLRKGEGIKEKPLPEHFIEGEKKEDDKRDKALKSLSKDLDTFLKSYEKATIKEAKQTESFIINIQAMKEQSKETAKILKDLEKRIAKLEK